MKQRKSTPKRQAPTYEPAGQHTSEQLDEAIRIFNDGPTDEALQAAFRVIATIPSRPVCRTSETYRTAYRAGLMLNAAKPAAKAPRRRVRQDPDLTRRYYRAMRRFGLWSAPGCDPSPLLEAAFQRLAGHKEPNHE